MKNVMLLLQHVAYNVNILRSIITHVTFAVLIVQIVILIH